MTVGSIDAFLAGEDLKYGLLFVPKCVNGIENGGSASRIEAEEYPDYRRKTEGKRDDIWFDQYLNCCRVQ